MYLFELKTHTIDLTQAVAVHLTGGQTIEPFFFPPHFTWQPKVVSFHLFLYFYIKFLFLRPNEQIYEEFVKSEITSCQKSTSSGDCYGHRHNF